MLFKKLIAMLTVLFACAGAATAMASDTPPQAQASQPVTEALLVDINQADAELLADLIQGVGSTRAQAIVEYREAHGPFQHVDELARVKGIGPAILMKNRDRIRLQ